LETVGLEEYFDEEAVIVAEWPERCPGAFEDWTLWLKLEPVGATARRIQSFAGQSSRSYAAFAELPRELTDQ
jgi:tRNA A37 threonylcarbamoyladenosine biosynthesis protein TsaE